MCQNHSSRTLFLYGSGILLLGAVFALFGIKEPKKREYEKSLGSFTFPL